MPRSYRLLLVWIFAGLAISGAEAQENKRPIETPSRAHLGVEAPFLAENSAAMSKMMIDMNVKPTGEIDADFSAMMIPHHQGAIDMALAELRYGKNEQMRRIAQEIIVEQQQEIIAMHMALGQPVPPSAAAQTQVSAAQPTGDQDHRLMQHGPTLLSPVKNK
jgi:Domain of unknown function (DUF305)